MVFKFQSVGAHSAGVGTLCDVVILKINLNLRGLSFSHGSGALKSCTLTVKLIRETLVEEFEVVSLGVTLMLGHRIKGSRTLDVFHRFRQLRLLAASPNRMERGEPAEGQPTQQAGERSSRGTFSSMNDTPPRPPNPSNGIGEELERMELVSSVDRSYGKIRTERTQSRIIVAANFWDSVVP